jgi:hypothetical protein
VRRGNIAALAATVLILAFPASAPAFDFLPGTTGFDANVYAEGGGPATQAGSHPLSVKLDVGFKASGGGPFSQGDLRDLSLEMPPGLIENPTAIATEECSQLDFETPRVSPWEESLSGESCPDNTQVGVVTVRSSFGNGATRTFGLFNLSAPPGAPSELGFSPYGAPVILVPSIRQSDGEYGITLQAKNVSQLLDISGLSLTIWGVPWSVIHNEQRGDCLKETEPAIGWAKCSVGRPKGFGSEPHAYLTLPTSCEEPLDFRATARSWEANEPQPEPRATSGKQTLEDCGALEF